MLAACSMEAKAVRLHFLRESLFPTEAVLPALSLAADLSFVQLELCRTKFVPVFGTLLGDRGFHGFQSSLRVSNRLGNWSWFRVLALPAYPSDHEPPASSKLNLNAADHFAYEGIITMAL